MWFSNSSNKRDLDDELIESYYSQANQGVYILGHGYIPTSRGSVFFSPPNLVNPYYLICELKAESG